MEMITLEYCPLINKAEYHSSYNIGERLIAISMDNIPVRGAVQYKYVVMVWDKVSKKPVYFITSESSPFNKGLQFLGVFEEGPFTHGNLGASDIWKNQDSFIAEAFDIIEEKFEEKILEIKSENDIKKSKEILECWLNHRLR
ncbi:hypothetical protein [Ilyobacter sp.]|uniref:hypothetical protein n=1 Tax=Ilyobacter sp. TaxID=3100343 RepID=UPI003563251A